jgi:anti-anti-sigma factor
MSYTVDVEESDSILFLMPAGEEFDNQDQEKMMGIVRAHTGKGIKGIIVNLRMVEYMPSLFLGTLVEILKEAKAKHIKFALAEAGEKSLYIIKATKLDTVFKIFGDSHEAYVELSK